MRDLICGYGEIGKAVHQVICPDASIYDKALANKHNKKRIGSIDVMHICFPPSDDFVNQVWDYKIHYEPKHIVIWSTVPIGTTKKIGKRVIHTPVEGKHPRLAKSIKTMTRWVGYNSKFSAKFFEQYFTDKGLRVELVADTNYTEALKLLSTTEYGVNIEFARYKKEVADAIGMDYQLTKMWNESYNQLYRELGMDRRYQKFVLDAPIGPKGGHCILPNAKILQEQYPNILVKIVGEI